MKVVTMNKLKMFLLILPNRFELVQHSTMGDVGKSA